MSTALLVVNFGGPRHAGEVEGFLYELFNDPDVITLGLGKYVQACFADLIAERRAPKTIAQYAQIGGGSPLVPMTFDQTAALKAALLERGITLPIEVGMRYTRPFIKDALKRLYEGGARRVVCLSLYPHMSFATTGSTINEVTRALKQLPPDLAVTHVPAWYWHPDYVAAMAARVADVLPGTPPDTHLLFSAHGLPVSFVKRGDPYPFQIEQTMRDILRALGWQGPSSLAYQSKVGPAEWLSPATDDALKDLGARGVKSVVVVPISFVGDHIETLFELDIEYRHVAEAAGIQAYRRAGALDLHPRFIAALADLVASAL